MKPANHPQRIGYSDLISTSDAIQRLRSLVPDAVLIRCSTNGKGAPIKGDGYLARPDGSPPGCTLEQACSHVAARGVVGVRLSSLPGPVRVVDCDGAGSRDWAIERIRLSSGSDPLGELLSGQSIADPDHPARHLFYRSASDESPTNINGKQVDLKAIAWIYQWQHFVDIVELAATTSGPLVDLKAALDSKPSSDHGEPPSQGPRFDVWAARYREFAAQRNWSVTLQGRELHGPCPRCNEGEDRFWIKAHGRGALVGCRQCGNDPAFFSNVKATLGIVPRQASGLRDSQIAAALRPKFTDWKYLTTHTSDKGRFHRFDGRRWKMMPVGVLRAAIGRELGTLIKKGYSVAQTKAVSTWFSDHLMDDLSKFDADIEGLNTKSGYLDLATGTLEAHSIDRKVTKICGTGIESGEPELWLKSLDTWFKGDADTIAAIQRLMGYSLRGDNCAHILINLIGDGQNGKTVFLSAWREVLGDYASVSADSCFLRAQGGAQHPTDVASLVGARLVTLSELNEGSRYDEQRLFRFTGGDRMTARFIGGDFFEFQPQALPIICGNFEPQINDCGKAARRRIILIPFSVTIPDDQKDERLGDKLRLEYPRILNWMWEGYRLWHTDGFRLSKTIRLRTETYFDDQDEVAQFMTDNFVIDADAQCPIAVVFEQYLLWCEAQKKRPMGQKRLNSRIVRLPGIELKRLGKARTRTFVGMRPIDENDRAAAAAELIGGHPF